MFRTKRHALHKHSLFFTKALSLSLSLYSSTVWPDWVIFDDLGDILNTLVNNFGNTSQNLVRFWTIFEMTKITFCHLDHCDWNVGYFSPKQPGHTLILKHSISYITHFLFHPSNLPFSLFSLSNRLSRKVLEFAVSKVQKSSQFHP